MFDLDGFKSYNDMFGHAAGDELLTGLADRLAAAVASRATAYRLGGDEFCLLIPGEPSQELLDDAIAALSAHGELFTVTTSAGSVVMPREAPSARDALMLADARMYADKGARSGSGRGQVREVLLQVLNESEPELHRHMSHVARLAHAVSRHMGLPVEQIDVTVRAAELHDVGKIAIPDSILHKPGPLDLEELSFMRKHTLIGERIVAAASALRPVAQRRAQLARALGRRRLPRRARRRGDPDRGAHRLRVRRLRRDDLRPALRAASDVVRRRARRDAAQRRHAVRPARRRGVRRGPRRGPQDAPLPDSAPAESRPSSA